MAIISGGGKFPTIRASGYAASKHAKDGFFSTLRLELAGSGVSVTLIYPPWVSTGITARAPGADGIPVGRLNVHEKGAMSPEVFAQAVARAAARRKGEDSPAILRLVLILRPLVPGVLDEVARRGLE